MKYNILKYAYVEFHMRVHRKLIKHVWCEDGHVLDIYKLGSIDTLALGFPCNNFSVAWEQLGFKVKYAPYSYRDYR